MAYTLLCPTDDFHQEAGSPVHSKNQLKKGNYIGELIDLKTVLFYDKVMEVVTKNGRRGNEEPRSRVR